MIRTTLKRCCMECSDSDINYKEERMHCDAIKYSTVIISCNHSTVCGKYINDTESEDGVFVEAVR